MRLSAYIQRTRALGDFKIEAHVLDSLAELLNQEGKGLADLLEKRTDTLNPRILLGVWRAYSRHTTHQSYISQVMARRAKEGQNPMPVALLKQTISRHEVAVMERAVALSPSGSSAEHRRRDAVKAAVSIWNACLAIVRKEALLKIALDTAKKPLIDEYGGFVDNVLLKDVPAHRWLGIRRGERLGALRLSFDLPLERMQGQVEARASEISAIASGRDSETLLEALVFPDLEEWALSLKDEEAQFLALKTASMAYLRLLSSPPTTLPVVAAVSIPARGSLGVAVMLGDGRMVGQGHVDASDNVISNLESVIGKHPVEALILPSKSPRPEILRQLDDGFANLDVIKVDARAIRYATNFVVDELPVGIKEAHVLAQRLVNPQAHWLALDPVRLGLIEYQHEFELEVLGNALRDMKTLTRAKVCPDDLQPSSSADASGQRNRPRPPPKALNPLVKSVDDLRPGMDVNGLVTNITQFGAFINIGLSHEGLVHVSELADHFVNNPNEVVAIGQQVSAQVLGVDRARRRISLSMRSDRKGRVTEGGDASQQTRPGTPLDDLQGRGIPRASSPTRNRSSGNVSRAQALADLEALFRKK